jgi:protein SCO1/2
MKTKIALSLLAFAGAVTIRATDAKKDSCCAIEPAKPACCVDEKSDPKALLSALPPLTARSLYQLEAKWTNDGGATVQLASLRGEPVLLAMFFASCEYACPVLVTDMLRVRDALPADVREKTRFVLVTFDVERDTPAALKAYRARMRLDERWTLLRGDSSNVQELAMLLGVKFKQDARGQFSHSNLITVLNRDGEIVHQRAGLMGDISEAAKAVQLAAK